MYLRLLREEALAAPVGVVERPRMGSEALGERGLVGLRVPGVGASDEIQAFAHRNSQLLPHEHDSRGSLQ